MIVLPRIDRTFKSDEARFELGIPELHLDAGQLIYVAGPNGSGKSLYLRTLAGDAIPGLVESKRRRRDGWPGTIFLKQEPDSNLAQTLTAWENLSLWRKPTSLFEWLFPFRFAMNETWTAAFPSLRDTWERNIDTLSGGQKQALALLSRSLGRGTLFLLDEITASVDASAAPLLLEFLKEEVIKSGRHALIAGHNIPEMQRYADRVLVLSSGTLFKDIRAPENGRISAETLTSVLYEAWRDHLEQPTPL